MHARETRHVRVFRRTLPEARFDAPANAPSSCRIAGMRALDRSEIDAARATGMKSTRRTERSSCAIKSNGGYHGPPFCAPMCVDAILLSPHYPALRTTANTGLDGCHNFRRPAEAVSAIKVIPDRPAKAATTGIGMSYLGVGAIRGRPRTDLVRRIHSTGTSLEIPELPTGAMLLLPPPST